MGTVTAERGYGVVVQVWHQNGRPTRFVWQGRLHVVQQVLDHWVTVRSDVSAAAGTHPPARVFWRVRAGTGSTSGRYELRHDLDRGDWLLARVGA